MKPLIFSLHGHDELAARVAEGLQGELGQVTIHRFPDGETYARLGTEVAGRAVTLVCNLREPDPKILTVLFVADAARELGATRVSLVAPYLPYMRQDKRFLNGEAITSRSFARLISGAVDALVTVDPHLHRYSSLEEIYSIPTTVVRAAPALSAWIGQHVASPVLIGPDVESAQWVAEVAERAGAPYTVLQKVRRGDREVEISVPSVQKWRGRTPVLVDDIISTGHTMIETIARLRDRGLTPPLCVGVHAVFAVRAYEELVAAGAAQIVTCNTIPHRSNAIELSQDIARAAASI